MLRKMLKRLRMMKKKRRRIRRFTMVSYLQAGSRLVLMEAYNDHFSLSLSFYRPLFLLICALILNGALFGKGGNCQALCPEIRMSALV